MPPRAATPALPAPVARRARRCAVAAALLLHGALALGLGLQMAQRPGQASGLPGPAAGARTTVLWLHWAAAPADTPAPQGAPVAPVAMAAAVHDSAASQAAAQPAAAERPVAAEQLRSRQGQALELTYPDIALAGGAQHITLEMQLDAGGQILAAAPAAGSVAAPELTQHLQAELEGASVVTSARRLCLHLSLDERDARVAWRLTQPAGTRPCRAA